jgi:hypothetical protein
VATTTQADRASRPQQPGTFVTSQAAVLGPNGRTRGTKLSHARFERVCFQVDELDMARRTGWSVLVKGVLR